MNKNIIVFPGEKLSEEEQAAFNDACGELKRLLGRRAPALRVTLFESEEEFEAKKNPQFGNEGGVYRQSPPEESAASAPLSPGDPRDRHMD